MIASATASPRSLRSPSTAAKMTSTSITLADESTEECVLSEATTAHRSGRGCPAAARFWMASCRAVTRAERFPIVPPVTKQPPAEAGISARSAIHRRAWFSAKTMPAPSNQVEPQSEEEPSTRSNTEAALVGAPGTKARYRGWSAEMEAGAR